MYHVMSDVTAKCLAIGGLFPTYHSLVIFLLYMTFFICQGLLVKGSQQSGHSYNYNTVTVVLFTEVQKLAICLLCLMKRENLSTVCRNCIAAKKLFVLYFIPAFLYCLYNNLAFVNLLYFDPTTYFILLQLRVVLTGVLFQMLFSKQLSRIQWVSLMVLTVGCIIKHVNAHVLKDGVSEHLQPTFLWSFHFGFIFLQVFCSCLAGVYNEKLLKDTGAEVDVFTQNIFMYLDSIICNVVVLVCKGEILTAFTTEGLSKICQPLTLLVMSNNAAAGIVTAFFLKSLNSILKNFASALEIVFTALLSWVIFGVPIDIPTSISTFLVIGATIIYAQNPVINRGRMEEVERTVNKKPCDSLTEDII